MAEKEIAERRKDRHKSKFTVRLPEELRPIIETMRKRSRGHTASEQVILSVLERARRLGVKRKAAKQ